MRNKQIKKLVFNLSEGLLSTVTDLLLLQFYVFGAAIGKGKTSRGAYRAVEEATKELEEFNYQTLKQTFDHLKRKGLIRSLQEPIITQLGKQRLNSLVPEYQHQRTWDKVIYLVTYDIQETKRLYRNKLRELLRKLGAAPLQASVWLTPYNPEKILREFSSTPGFAGEIIVSCVGKDGYIGEEQLGDLIYRIYNLDKINQRYQQFIDQYKQSHDKWNAAVLYLSILKDDPQLPFELLADDWVGDQAYLIYKNLTKN
ncbi:CRISPR-associated endonuclease Cas2 [Microgenomates group bacterium]|nr:CRISPR-associated endonuclease Cas2 [Microgenomates group bacterium]